VSYLQQLYPSNLVSSTPILRHQTYLHHPHCNWQQVCYALWRSGLLLAREVISRPLPAVGAASASLWERFSEHQHKCRNQSLIRQWMRELEWVGEKLQEIQVRNTEGTSGSGGECAIPFLEVEVFCLLRGASEAESSSSSSVLSTCQFT